MSENRYNMALLAALRDGEISSEYFKDANDLYWDVADLVKQLREKYRSESFYQLMQAISEL